MSTQRKQYSAEFKEAIGLTIGALGRLDPACDQRNFAVLMR